MGRPRTVSDLEFESRKAQYAYIAKYARTLKGRYTALKCTCKRKNLQILTKRDYAVMLKLPCTYCDGPLSGSGSGLDRINPGGNYSLDNVVPCCGDCNWLKGRRLTVQETRAVAMLLKRMRIP